MKLKIQNWKAAWFDSHISDRFFGEMSRLEKGTINELETSAQWMEQVMIEVGQLAQAMIRLENQDTPEPQIRQAMEKALRLSALSLQLMTTLDGLDRELLKSGQRQFANAPVPAGGKPISYEPVQVPTPPPKPEPKGAPADPEKPVSSIPSYLMQQMTRQAEPAPQTEKPPPEPPAPEAEISPPPSSDEKSEPSFPEINPFLSLASIKSEAGDRRMRDTIVSLSNQGLSRAEIEAVTGEPRHVIEAVINHAQGG